MGEILYRTCMGRLNYAGFRAFVLSSCTTGRSLSTRNARHMYGTPQRLSSSKKTLYTPMSKLRRFGYPCSHGGNATPPNNVKHLQAHACLLHVFFGSRFNNPQRSYQSTGCLATMKTRRVGNSAACRLIAADGHALLVVAGGLHTREKKSQKIVTRDT